MKHEFNLADAIDVIEEVLASGGEFQMFPKGTSMLPLIHQGRDSVTLVRHVPMHPIRRYQIAFYRRDNGQFVLHRIVKIGKDGCYTMCGDNQLQYEPGIRQEQIIGVVSSMNRKGRERKMRGFGNAVYVLTHCVSPMRHISWFLRHGTQKIMRIFAARKSKSS